MAASIAQQKRHFREEFLDCLILPQRQMQLSQRYCLPILLYIHKGKFSKEDLTKESI